MLLRQQELRMNISFFNAKAIRKYNLHNFKVKYRDIDDIRILIT